MGGRRVQVTGLQTLRSGPDGDAALAIRAPRSRSSRTYVEKCRPFRGAGKPDIVGDFGFELVCENCLEIRGVLDSERLPEECPSCGARRAWKGPFAERFSRDAEQLTESPFYLGASRTPE